MDLLREHSVNVPPPPLPPIPLPPPATKGGSQSNKKRNLSEQSFSDGEDHEGRKKIWKESTSPLSANGSFKQEDKVGSSFSIIDLSGDNDISLHSSLISESTLKPKSLACELNEAMSKDYLAKNELGDQCKDSIYVRMEQVRKSSTNKTSTPVRPTQTLISSFLKNMKRLNYIEGGFPLDNENESSKETDNKSIAENTFLTQENNACLKEIAKVLESVDKTVTIMSERLGHLEVHVEETIVRLDKRLDENGRLIEVLADEIVAKNDDMKSYVDRRVSGVTKELPNLLATMGKDVDAKIALNSETLLQTMEERVGMLPNSSGIHEICTKGANEVVTERNLAKQADLELLIRRVEALEKGQQQTEKNSRSSGPTADLGPLREQISDVVRNNERSHFEISGKINEIENKLGRIQNDEQNLSDSGHRTSWLNFRQKTEDLLQRFPKVEYRINEIARQVNVHDMKHRKLNVLIEHLVETENENTLERVNAILDLVLNDEEKVIAKVAKAYRLGRFNQGKIPRKILLEMRHVDGKDIILGNAKRISKVGNEGRAYYINEDLPEAHKRWRSDIHKYINFMTKKKHTVEWHGDELVIDGVRRKIRDLDDMPPGERLLDSRTIFHRGVVAFQSHLSPLSNLFPCRIRYNGITFASLEHAYQHSKVIFHGRTDLAEAILADDDPYVAMSQGKQITNERVEWSFKKLEVMAGLLRHKADQCPAFHNTLKATYGHTLVENSWNSFWGSATPFACEAVWALQFKGANHLGKLLEKLRQEV